MKNILFLFSYALCIVSSVEDALSQAPLQKQWDYRYGGTERDVLHAFQQTKDGGYILGGVSLSPVSGDKSQDTIGASDYWIIKIDSLGSKQWDEDIGGTDVDHLWALQQTSDGGYILGGTSHSGIGGDKTQDTIGNSDYWIVKTDSLGVIQWDKDFGGDSAESFFSLQQTADGGFILGGFSSSGISGHKTQPTQGGMDYWIIKTDALGNIEWDKDFGGTADDQLYFIQQTSDHGFMLGGFSYSDSSGDKTQPLWGNCDYWIVKTDSMGNKEWDKDFGGTDIDCLYSLQQTSDGGYILGGFSSSGIGGDKTQSTIGGADYWIVKTDSLGNKEWDKDFGGSDEEDNFGIIFQTPDGGYLIPGSTYSPISGDKTEANLGIEQTWIVKTDASGNKEWDKTLLTLGHVEVSLSIITNDGCYAFANFDDGGMGGDRTQGSQGVEDYWIIKFCDTTLCNIPTPLITQIEDTLFVPAQYVTYQWFFGSASIAGATNYFYVAGTSGNYNIVVTDSSGCTVGAGILNVETGIKQLAVGSWQLAISPNPVDDELAISSSQSENYSLEIFNSLGEKICSQNFFANCKLQTANRSNGIYFLKIMCGEKIATSKLVISH